MAVFHGCVQWIFYGEIMGRLWEDYIILYYIIYIYNTNMSSLMDCVWKYGMPSNSNSNAKMMINQRFIFGYPLRLQMTSLTS